jgi:hypothetical protein
LAVVCWDYYKHMSEAPDIPFSRGSDASRLRRRARLLLARFHVPDDALPGSLALSHRRCGKPSCHCAWEFAHLRYGESSTPADRWVHQIAEDLRAGKVQEVIARLKRVRPKTPELRESLQALIRYYRENAGRMRYDEYLRRGYGIGSGAVESAHKQVVHARFRQAGMRWSEAGARRLLALRLLLLNDNWALLDRLRMVSLA